MQDDAIIKISPLGFPWETRDPFIFCVHHNDAFPKGNDKMEPAVSLEGRNIGQDFTIKDGWRMYHGKAIPGFPCHPHRGFETVTVVKEGLVDHSDSLGSAGRYGAGDVQWLTAGKGIQHCEMFPLVDTEKENPLELFQIWLNLPKKSKFVEPHFKMLWAEDIPVHTETKGVEINIIAGMVNGISAPSPTPNSWAADTKNELAILTIELKKNCSWTIPVASDEVNRTIYFYRGKNLLINAEEIDVYHSVQLRADKNVKLEAGEEDCYILLLQGKPINEPVVQYGPFVMNTEAEIQDAFEDFRKTHFGGWPWPSYEHAHSKHKGRFSLNADGKEVVK